MLAVTLVVAVPVAAIAQDVDGARDAVDGLQSDIVRATEGYEQTVARIEQAVLELERLEDEALALEQRAAELDARLADRARRVFMLGPGSQLEMLLMAEDPDDAVQRAALVAALQERDMAGIEEAVATRIALDQVSALVERRRGELEALEQQLVLDREELETELEAAQGRLASLEALAARQRHLDGGSQRGVYACPLDRSISHFVDSWGAPRSGGRRHQGTDIMGPMGAPVYAFTSGVIARHSNSRLGGISLYLRGDDGNTYFYTHLQGYAPRGAVGSRVVAGEHIAYNGNTGNARGGAPHIHFERKPGGGRSVNPYPYLAAACF